MWECYLINFKGGFNNFPFFFLYKLTLGPFLGVDKSSQGYYFYCAVDNVVTYIHTNMGGSTLGPRWACVCSTFNR